MRYHLITPTISHDVMCDTRWDPRACDEEAGSFTWRHMTPHGRSRVAPWGGAALDERVTHGHRWEVALVPRGGEHMTSWDIMCSQVTPGRWGSLVNAAQIKAASAAPAKLAKPAAAAAAAAAAPPEPVPTDEEIRSLSVKQLKLLLHRAHVSSQVRVVLRGGQCNVQFEWECDDVT